MYSDLKDYQPKQIEFCIDEAIKEKFPSELDFSNVEVEGSKCENVSDIMKLVSQDFVATFPENEFVVRKLDDFEKLNINEWQFEDLRKNALLTVQSIIERYGLSKKDLK